MLPSEHNPVHNHNYCNHRQNDHGIVYKTKRQHIPLFKNMNKNMCEKLPTYSYCCQSPAKRSET